MPFLNSPGSKKAPACWLTKPTNRRTNFCISFFRIFVPWLCSNRALIPVGGSETGTSQGKVPPRPRNTSKISFLEHKFQENKKAAPSDTLSVPLKISRLVWLYGAAIRIWTGALILTKSGLVFFLIFFNCFQHFPLESICFLSLFGCAVSVHSTAVCGWLCGQSGGSRFHDLTVCTKVVKASRFTHDNTRVRFFKQKGRTRVLWRVLWRVWNNKIRLLIQ